MKSPALTTDGSELVWLQRDAGGPHAATMSLVKTSIPVTTKVVLLWQKMLARLFTFCLVVECRDYRWYRSNWDKNKKR